MQNVRSRASDKSEEAAMIASDWRPLERNTLRGFVTLHMPSGLVLRGCTLHRDAVGKEWVGLPGKPQIDREGQHRKDPTTGKLAYLPVVEIEGKAALPDGRAGGGASAAWCRVMTPAATLTVTFFDDYAAQTKREERVALAELAQRIRDTTASAKASLPWLKLARFGNTKTLKGSLRHDANVIAITGVEADYDGEELGFDAAIDIAEKAGLGCILYTSPSHTDARPRWRVLAPVRRAAAPPDRARFVARLNGLYRGVFAVESWTLSQSYYLGAVAGNPAHRVELVEGQCIDELDELDLIAIGKPNGSAGAHATTANGSGGPLDEDSLAAEIVSGAGYHVASVRLVGKWAQAGVPFLDAQHRLEKLFDQVFPADRDQRWRTRCDDIPRTIRDIYGKDAGREDAQDEAATEKAVSLDDFYAYMPAHNYIYVPTRTFWPGASINSRILPIKLTDEAGQPARDKDDKPVMLSPSRWLDQYKPVEQMTWAPGLPMVIHDKLILAGGWIDRNGVTCFNLYQPPIIAPGDAAKAGPWLDHVSYVFPEEAEHIIDWLAHRVQRPQDKINHALVLGGSQGIGKDTILEPVKYAVGGWNFHEVSPQQILGRFNGFLKSVILRVNEARDLGEFDRFAFYDHMKAYTAAPPDVLRVDEKFMQEHSIRNCCGVIITTNEKTGIYLPTDDRRHFVVWSDRKKEDERFQDAYWNKMWAYYANGGLQHVAAYLMQRNIRFDPKAPPPKTPAFWTIVDANRPSEDAELADLLESIGSPDAVTLSRMQNGASGDTAAWLNDRKNRRVIPHRLESCGYVPVRNPDADDGLWKILGRRQAVYARDELHLRDRILAARALA
jgi:hypothetical protein